MNTDAQASNESLSSSSIKLTDFEKKWGVVCTKCGIRKGTVNAMGNSEPGRTSVCKCDDK